MREFRTTGERRQLVDRHNALGKSTEGALNEMPHAHPELRLPNNYVDRFMRPARAVVPPTIEDLTARRDELKDQLDQAQAELDAAVKAEQDAQAEAAQKEREADEKKLAEAQAELDRKAQEVADLKAKLGKPPEPPKP
jgi:chromosome segregation ATPase